MILLSFLLIFSTDVISRYESSPIEQDGCLLVPYISSIDTFQITNYTEYRDATTPNSSFVWHGHLIDTSLTVNYGYTVELKNLSLMQFPSDIRQNHMIMHADGRMIIKPDEQEPPGEIVYSRASYLVQEGEINVKRDISYTRKIALEETKRLHSGMKLDQEQASANDVAKPCSRAYIYDAAFVIPLRPESDERYLYVRIHRSMLCYLEFSASEPISFEAEFAQSTSKFELQHNIVAAAYYNSLLIFALASNALTFHASIDLAERLLERPKKHVFPTTSPLWLTRGPVSPSTDRVLLNSRSCDTELNNLIMNRPFEVSEYYNIKPPRAVTRSITDKSLLLIVDSLSPNRIFLYNQTQASNPNNIDGNPSKIWPKMGLLNQFADWNIAALAIYPFGYGHRGHIILEFNGAVRYIDGVIEPNYSIELTAKWKIYEKGAIPDDITYWSSCEKMVSFYGFLYAIHDHKANILSDPGIWSILPEGLADFPIEAAHADGDDFFLFVRATTLYHAVADGSRCGQLNFIEFDKKHHDSQFFGLNLMGHFRTEDRYFDGKKWIPGWEENLYDQLVHDFRKDIDWTWLYGALGLVSGSVLFIAVIVAIAKCYRPSIAHGTMVNSRSRTLSHDRSDGSKSTQPPMIDQQYPYYPPQPPHPSLLVHGGAAKSPTTANQGQQYKAPMMAPSEYQGIASAMPLFSEYIGREAAKTPSGKVKSKKTRTKTPASPSKQKKHKQPRSGSYTQSPASASKSPAKKSPRSD